MIEVPMKRSAELDALRGLCLLAMTCTHLQTAASQYSSEFAGSVSSAAGFVLLAAYLMGHREFTRAEVETAALRRRFRRRAWTIYRHQLTLLVFSFTVVAGIATLGDRPDLRHLLV